MIDNYGCYQHNTVLVKSGHENWIVYSEGVDVIQSLVEDIRANGNRVTVRRDVNYEEVDTTRMVNVGPIIDDIHPRQQDIVKVAYDLGYYNPTSNVTIDDVAEEADLHRSTVWEHLNNVENTIMEYIVERVIYG